MGTVGVEPGAGAARFGCQDKFDFLLSVQQGFFNEPEQRFHAFAGQR
jgi:hypothetical protein